MTHFLLDRAWQNYVNINAIYFRNAIDNFPKIHSESILWKIVDIKYKYFNSKSKQCCLKTSTTERSPFKYHINMFKRKRKRSDSVLWQTLLYQREIQKTNWQHQNAIKNADFTTIADLLRTVSLSNNRYPAGVVKPVYGYPTFAIPTYAV